MNRFLPTSSPEVRKVDGRSALRDFLHVPHRLYHGNPYWVAPLYGEEKRFLSPRHNHFLSRNPVALFVCYRGGIPVGRIAAIINRDHLERYRDHVGFFGFFDSENDRETAAALLQTASRWVKDRGAQIMRGPANFSINSTAGLLVDGFEDPPQIMMPYNHAYAVDLLEANGFKRCMTFLAYEVSRDQIRFPAAVSRLEERLARNGTTIRHLASRYLNRDAELIRTVFNQAWSGNWGFIPFSIEEVQQDFKRVRPFFKEDLVFIAEHKGRPVGFCLSLPDINQALQPLGGRLMPFNWLRLLLGIRKISRLRVILMGVAADHRRRGIDLVFYKKTFDHAEKYGIHTAELSWILEDNRDMNRVLEHINAHCYKRYAIYEKHLNRTLLSSFHMVSGTGRSGQSTDIP